MIRFALFLSLITLANFAHADYVHPPFGCKPIDTVDGYYQIIEYRQSCSLRQAPELISECKRNVYAKESPHFAQYEPTFEKNCYNKNGYTRTTTCLDNNVYETKGPYATWTYQSAKMMICHYK